MFSSTILSQKSQNHLNNAIVFSGFDLSTGRVGGPTTVCDIQLIDWEEGNYRVTDRPYPRGEIAIGGNNISPGYYKNPQKTKEDFFEFMDKRWFQTGDIGEIHPDGVIKIIGKFILIMIFQFNLLSNSLSLAISIITAIISTI